jgi:hypothetical protein
MAGKNGATILIAVNTGTPSEPTWTVIPCQTDGSYTINTATIDDSCKDSGDATNLPGRRTRSISGEFNLTAWPTLVESPATAVQYLRKAAETGLQVPVRIMDGAAPVESGVATIENLEVSFPDQDKVTGSIDLAISGAMTPVAP